MCVARRIISHDVLDQLYELFLIRGTPDHIQSVNGPEFTVNAVMMVAEGHRRQHLFIEPGSPWENGCVESYIGKLRDELLNGKVLDALMEAKVLIEGWRQGYNRFRPQSSPGYRPPAPEARWFEKLNHGVVH